MNLYIAPGKWIGLLGLSGIGKSSLLHFIAGLTEKETTSGIIKCDNSIPICQQVSYMAQTDLLLPWIDGIFEYDYWL